LYALALWLPLAAGATSLTTDDMGKVTGIADLEVGSHVFTLSFVDFGASYQTVFGGALDISNNAQSRSIVAAAAVALNSFDVLNTDIAGNPVASVADDTNLLLPFFVGVNNVFFYELDWREPDAWRNQPVGPVPVNINSSQADTAWIRVSKVPVPGTALLLGYGLLGLLALGRRRRG
jgi:hypothetical protein